MLHLSENYVVDVPFKRKPSQTLPGQLGFTSRVAGMTSFQRLVLFIFGRSFGGCKLDLMIWGFKTLQKIWRLETWDRACTHIKANYWEKIYRKIAPSQGLSLTASKKRFFDLFKPPKMTWGKTNMSKIFGCFQKSWYPQIINFNRVFHYKPSILGYHYFWKHPFDVEYSGSSILGVILIPGNIKLQKGEQMIMTQVIQFVTFWFSSWRSLDLWKGSLKHPKKGHLSIPKRSLAGGWTTPFQKYARQIGSFPQG